MSSEPRPTRRTVLGIMIDAQQVRARLNGLPIALRVLQCRLTNDLINIHEARPLRRGGPGRE